MIPESSPLLEQLRDIHGAAQPGWWPPAPGWWVVGAVLLALLVLLTRKLLHWLALRRRRKAWLRELDQLNRAYDPLSNPREYLAGLNCLFRAIAVKAFPGTGCARLQGEKWVEWIRAMLPEQAEDDGLGALATGPYEEAPAFDANALGEIARTWVKRYG